MKNLKILFDQCVEDIRRHTEKKKLNRTFSRAEVVDFICIYILVEDINKELFHKEVLESHDITIAVKELAQELRKQIPMVKERIHLKKYGYEYYIPMPKDRESFIKYKSLVELLVECRGSVGPNEEKSWKIQKKD